MFIKDNFLEGIDGIRKMLRPQVTGSRKEVKFETLKYDKVISKDKEHPGGLGQKRFYPTRSLSETASKKCSKKKDQG